MFKMPLKWFNFSQLYSEISNGADETNLDLIARRRDQSERKIKVKGQSKKQRKHAHEKEE